MRVFLGVTGASGALYAGRALRALTAAGCDVGLCVSDAGAHVISHEILEAGPRPPDDPGLVVATFVEGFTAGPGSVTVLGLTFGAYRLFLISVALGITVLLIGALEYTRFGAQVRAAVDNQRMANGLGINVDGAFAFTFALGSGLAGIGGALAIEIVGLDPSFAFTYLIYVLIVVSVGGLGSIAGSFVAAILIGISDVAGKYYVPELGAFLIYLVMVALLMWRPSGLFGKR